MAPFFIDYDFLLNQAPSTDLDETIAFLVEELPYEWHDAYREMVGAPTAVYQFSDGEYEYLFDRSDELVRAGAVDESVIQEDRVVAAFGRSHRPKEKRDESRMRGFLGAIGARWQGKTNKGHLMAHAAGGGMDVNLFPQQEALNLGRSAEGKIFRSMERYCQKNIGTFFFLRPIYGDRTWRPTDIEFGILKPERQFWIEQFSNRPFG